MENVPIFYINLERSKDRRKRMESQFAAYGITNYEKVEAFDGKRLYSEPGLLARTVDLPPQVKQSPGEIGCSLSHVRAAQVVLERSLDYALIMEDDIHLTFYENWTTTIKDIVAQAPGDWTVLQLTINNVRVLRTIVGLGVPFVPWRSNHWSTGAYIINRKGCQRCIAEYAANARYKLPQGVKLVSDILMFNGPGTYTYTKPLFDHEIRESTIHQSHVELCHRQASELGHKYYHRIDLIWAGGDDCRAAIITRLHDAARKDQRDRLRWWIQFHLRIGFRWIFLYIEEDTQRHQLLSEYSWLANSLCIIPTAAAVDDSGPASHIDEDSLIAIDAISRARLAGASWLLRLADNELLYTLPGRSLRSVFDEPRRIRSQNASTVFNLQFDNLEVQKSATQDDELAFNSSYNFFEQESLFKRRNDHANGTDICSSDERAFYEQTSATAHLRRLPKRQSDTTSGQPQATTFLDSASGRSAGRLSAPGLAPDGPSLWSSYRGRSSTGTFVSSRAFVLSYPHCHYDTWYRQVWQSCEISATKEKNPKDVYSSQVLMPRTDMRALSQFSPRKAVDAVYLALPPGCVRSDCEGTYTLVHDHTCTDDNDFPLYQQQGGVHHMYRISTPFVAWMVGRTPFSSTAALVAHDVAKLPQDIRATWSAFDGRRWATLPVAQVRLEPFMSSNGDKYAVITAPSVLTNDVDTLRALMLPPPRYTAEQFQRLERGMNYNETSQTKSGTLRSLGSVECWTATASDGRSIGQFLTAEEAESAIAAVARCEQRENYIHEVKDSGAVLVELPATCGAAADACAGIYIPQNLAVCSKSSKTENVKVFRHEGGAHYLYFYSPFLAWMIGSKPGSGSAALIAYDGADQPEEIHANAPWRVYDGQTWREVSSIRIRALADVAGSNVSNGLSTPSSVSTIACSLKELTVYPWTPVSEQSNQKMPHKHPPLSVRTHKYLVYTCAGDRAVIPYWLKNGNRNFDLWVTYYGDDQEDKWKSQADIYRRRKGGKFENLQAMIREEPKLLDRLQNYDAVMVMDDDVVIDSLRLNCIFQIRTKYNILCVQPAFERRGKVSHAITAVQPGNQLRYTNFIEMTCPVFAANILLEFLNVFDPQLKGWGADWWFLTLVAREGIRNDKRDSDQNTSVDPAIALRGHCAVIDAITCINPTENDKGGVREINVLQGREARRAVWEKIRKREKILEWEHVQFDSITLDKNNIFQSHHQKGNVPVRINGCRPYKVACT